MEPWAWSLFVYILGLGFGVGVLKGLDTKLHQRLDESWVFAAFFWPVFVALCVFAIPGVLAALLGAWLTERALTWREARTARLVRRENAKQGALL